MKNKKIDFFYIKEWEKYDRYKINKKDLIDLIDFNWFFKIYHTYWQYKDNFIKRFIKWKNIKRFLWKIIWKEHESIRIVIVRDNIILELWNKKTLVNRYIFINKKNFYKKDKEFISLINKKWQKENVE